MKFVETSVFTRRITEVVSDDEYRLLQEALLRRPMHGDLIEGTGEDLTAEQRRILAKVVKQELK